MNKEYAKARLGIAEREVSERQFANYVMQRQCPHTRAAVYAAAWLRAKQLQRRYWARRVAMGDGAGGGSGTAQTDVRVKCRVDDHLQLYQRAKAHMDEVSPL